MLAFGVQVDHEHAVHEGQRSEDVHELVNVDVGPLRYNTRVYTLQLVTLLPTKCCRAVHHDEQVT